MIVEPVDADHRPVPPGTVSRTVLITNLANRVQLIIRYDVGDRILVRPDPCPCGDPAPAIRVQGRASDVLIFPAADGRGVVTVPPLALGTVVDRTPGVELSKSSRLPPQACRCGCVRTRTQTPNESVRQYGRGSPPYSMTWTWPT